MVAEAQLERASYYDLLRVPPGVDRGALQQSFHAFAWAFHPDRHLDEEPDVQAAAKRVFERGVEAYTVLRNPAAVELYDQRLREGALRLSAEDFQRLDRFRGAGRSTLRPPSRPPPTPEDAFVSAMKTPDGKIVAERVERLIQEQRYREAYLQVGLLETMEPDNPEVRKRADKIAAYLKRVGQR